MDVTLFDVPLPLEVPAPMARASDPQTSHDAKRAVTPGRTEAKILEVLGDFYMTDDEIAYALRPMHGPTVKSARSRLTKAGLVVDAGFCRLSERGQRMTVWCRAQGG